MSIDIIGDTIYYMNKPVADIRDDVMPSFRDKFQEEVLCEGAAAEKVRFKGQDEVINAIEDVLHYFR